jgi:hypothetical protein
MWEESLLLLGSAIFYEHGPHHREAKKTEELGRASPYKLLLYYRFFNKAQRTTTEFARPMNPYPVSTCQRPLPFPPETDKGIQPRIVPRVGNTLLREPSPKFAPKGFDLGGDA